MGTLSAAIVELRVAACFRARDELISTHIDCGYVYDRKIFGGRYFEEQTFGFKCLQPLNAALSAKEKAEQYWQGDWVCADCGPRRRYAKMVGDTVGVTLDGGDGPILLASGVGFLITIAIGFYISNSDF